MQKVLLLPDYPVVMAITSVIRLGTDNSTVRSMRSIWRAKSISSRKCLGPMRTGQQPQDIRVFLGVRAN